MCPALHKIGLGSPENIFLQFPIDGENKNMLPFFDVLVEEISTSLVTSEYSKVIFLWIFLSLDSFAPKPKVLPTMQYCPVDYFSVEG